MTVTTAKTAKTASTASTASTAKTMKPVKTTARVATSRKGPAGVGRSAGPAGPARRVDGSAAEVRSEVPTGGRDPGGPPPDLPVIRAREQLGLEVSEFELAVQLGEITTVRDGTGRPRVPAAEIARIRRSIGGTDALLARIRLVSTTSGAELLGISRDRLLRLTKAGRVRPARWYVNRYRAVVWLYLVGELREFAAGNPALLAGRLPAELRTSAEADEDLRPRRWRAREVARLLGEAPGP